MNSIPRRCRRGASILLATASLTGCVGGVAVEQSAWQGDLVGPPTGVTGSVAALSQSDRTHASIGFQRGVPGQLYAWRLEQGNCQTTGAIFGAAAVYPQITADETGNGQAEAFLSQTLGSGPYAGRLLLVSSGGTQSSVACGVLQRVD